ncbi:unnamed protein product, partial [marine sediment metagenome]
MGNGDAGSRTGKICEGSYYESISGRKSPSTNCRGYGVSGIIETINYPKANR